jgi:hypothetical protein
VVKSEAALSYCSRQQTPLQPHDLIEYRNRRTRGPIHSAAAAETLGDLMPSAIGFTHMSRNGGTAARFPMVQVPPGGRPLVPVRWRQTEIEGVRKKAPFECPKLPHSNGCESFTIESWRTESLIHYSF